MPDPIANFTRTACQATDLKNSNSSKNNIWAGIFLTLFWLLFLCNPLNNISGFDQEDDHIIAGMHRDFQAGKTVTEQISIELKSDQGMRFRPLWVVMRVSLASIFGTHWQLYSIYHALLAALSSYLLCRTGRLLTFSGFACAALAILPLLGQQLQGYIWRAPQEPLAVVFSAWALYTITRSAIVPARQWLYMGIFSVAALGFSLTKESFVLIYPALWFWRVVVLVVWAHMPLLRSIKKSGLWLLLTVVLFGVSLGLVIFNAGTGSGYLGIEAPSVSGYQKYIDAGLSLLSTIPGLVFIIVLFLVSCVSEPEQGRTRPLMAVLMLLLFGLFWVMPQVIMFAKSGFYPRYFLPAVLGLWLSVLGAYNRATIVSLTVTRQITAILIVAIAVSSYYAITYMKFLGQWRQGWTEVILDVQARVGMDSKIAVIADPYEDYGYGKNMYDFLTGQLGIPGKNLSIHYNPSPPYDPDPDNREHKIGVLSPLYQNNVITDMGSLANFDVVTVPLYQVQKQDFYEKYAIVLSEFQNTTGTRHVHFYRDVQKHHRK